MTLNRQPYKPRNARIMARYNVQRACGFTEASRQNKTANYCTDIVRTGKTFARFVSA